MQQKKIFERLYQESGTSAQTFPGFGMGLYISNAIITKHEGSMWVESEKGKGSIFCFTLPLIEKKQTTKKIQILKKKALSN